MTLLSKMNAKRTQRTKVVGILMDASGAEERDRLSRALMAATEAARQEEGKDARLGKSSPEVAEAQAALDAHNALMAESVLYVRLTAMPNAKWRQLHAGFPPRKNNPYDKYGQYNVDEVLRRTLEDHAHVATREDADESEWEKPDKDEIKDFLDEIPGGEWSALFYAMHNLNEQSISTEGLKKG